MHTTPTVDYCVVLSGEVWLELDDGALPCPRAAGTIVPNGTGTRGATWAASP